MSGLLVWVPGKPQAFGCSLSRREFLSPRWISDWPPKKAAQEINYNSSFVTTAELVNSTSMPYISIPLINCSEGFFYDQNGTGFCRPKCGKLLQEDYALVILERITLWISLIASVILFIMVLTYQNRTSVFPSILLAYLCVTTFLLAAVVIVGSFVNEQLFCSSEDQIYTLGQGNETTYCTFSGIVFHYCLIQICVWTLLHAIFLFWSLHFPFSYGRLLTSGRVHYAHIISVLMALLVPLPGALLPLKEGFLSTRNPSYVCLARDAVYVYFFLVLPISIILAISSILMLASFWTMHCEKCKVYAGISHHYIML